MNRVNVTVQTEDECGNPTTKLVGWYDADKATGFDEAKRSDGSNLISVPTGSQWNHEQLVQTAGGRFVMYRWSQWQGAVDSYEFIGADAAREWLVLNEHDAEVERLFGAPVEPERGPGRPEIGPMVNVRMPAEMVALLDADAAGEGLSRAELVRSLIARQYGAAASA